LEIKINTFIVGLLLFIPSADLKKYCFSNVNELKIKNEVK